MEKESGKIEAVHRSIESAYVTSYIDGKMGNIHSSRFRTYDAEKCLICWEYVLQGPAVQCLQCNIIIHTHCEEKWRDDKGYCKCIHCGKVGLLGTITQH